MQDELEEKFLPNNFVYNTQNACKLLLYKFLLDECQLGTSQGYEVTYIAARLVYDAWPILIERELSFGIQDKILFVCKHIQKSTNDSNRPSVGFIKGCLEERLFSPFIKDVKNNLAKTLDYWREKCFCPYKMSKIGHLPYIETNEKWIDYCRPLINHCRALYFDTMISLLNKKNKKDLKEVSEYLKNCFGETIECHKFLTEDISNIQASVVPKTAMQVDGISEAAFEILQRIPVSFLFQQKKCIGCCSQLLTLEKQPQIDITFIADVFSADQFKRKWIADIVEFVKENCSRIISTYNYFNKLPEIPANVFEGMPLGISMKIFIEEYVDRIKNKLAFIAPAKAEPKQRRLDVFTALYDTRDERIVTRSSLAQTIGCTREFLRHLLLGDDDVGQTICANVLKGLDSTPNFILNPSFQAAFMQFEMSDAYAFPLEQFDEEYGFIDEKTKTFLFDITEWKQTTSLPSYVGQAVIRNCDVANVSKALTVIRTFLDEKFFPASLEDEIVPEVMKKIKIDNQSLNVVCDIIKKSVAFEQVFSDTGETLYILKWQHLCSIPSRLAKILYEMGKPTHLKDVYTEYNRRATEYGLYAEDDLDWFTKRPHRFIRSDGKGTWEFSLDSPQKASPQKSVISTIEDYIKEQSGKVTFEGTVTHLLKLGYETTEKSIRTYLSNLCRTVRNTSGNVFVYKPWINSFPHLNVASERNKLSEVAIPIFINKLRSLEGYATVRMLCDAYYRETGTEIREVSARTIIDNHSELFKKERIDERNIRIVLVNNGENTFPSESSTNFHDRIRDDVIKMLRNVEGHQMRMNLVTRKVSRHVPKDKYSNIVYTIINNMKNVEKYEVEGKTYLRLIE